MTMSEQQQTVAGRLDRYTATRPPIIRPRPDCLFHIVDPDDPTPIRRCVTCGQRIPDGHPARTRRPAYTVTP